MQGGRVGGTQGGRGGGREERASEGGSERGCVVGTSQSSTQDHEGQPLVKAVPTKAVARDIVYMRVPLRDHSLHNAHQLHQVHVTVRGRSDSTGAAV